MVFIACMFFSAYPHIWQFHTKSNYFVVSLSTSRFIMKFPFDSREKFVSLFLFGIKRSSFCWYVIKFFRSITRLVYYTIYILYTSTDQVLNYGCISQAENVFQIRLLPFSFLFIRQPVYIIIKRMSNLFEKKISLKQNISTDIHESESNTEYGNG